MQGRIDVCALLGGSCLGTQGLATSTVAIQSVSIADCPPRFQNNLESHSNKSYLRFRA